jgi:hypothetical protein
LQELPEAVLEAGLAQLVRLRGRRGGLRIERIDGVAAVDSALRPCLEAVGFVADYRGLVLEKRFA